MKFGSTFAGVGLIAALLLVGCEAQSAVDGGAQHDDLRFGPVRRDASRPRAGDELPVGLLAEGGRDPGGPARGVDVELAPQKSEDAIDNPKVFVRVSDQFDADAAVEKLATAGLRKIRTSPRRTDRERETASGGRKSPAR